jgi:hypothetical protein
MNIYNKNNEYLKTCILQNKLPEFLFNKNEFHLFAETYIQNKPFYSRFLFDSKTWAYDCFTRNIIDIIEGFDDNQTLKSLTFIKNISDYFKNNKIGWFDKNVQDDSNNNCQCELTTVYMDLFKFFNKSMIKNNFDFFQKNKVFTELTKCFGKNINQKDFFENYR